MDRRQLAYVTMAALAVLCLAMIAGVLFPLSTADPTPATERFAVGDAESYRLAANITTEGEVSLAVVGRVSASEARYSKVTTGNVTTASYRNASDADVVYFRTVADGEQAERLLSQRREDPNVSVVDESRDGETLTMLAVDRSNDAQADPTGGASVVASSLRLARFEAVGSDSGAREVAADSDVTVLAPRADWYESRETYRLTDVAGNVTVDSETNVLYDAHVEWTLTDRAGTYLHYLLASAADANRDQIYEYTYEPGEVDVERPAWVERVRAAG